MQLHRSVRDLRSVAKPALAGLLAVLLLLLTTLSVCPSLHQLLHHGTGTSEENCVVCLFAHGQVHAADVAPVRTAFVFGQFTLESRPNAAAPASVDYRFSPSRAPPPG